MEGTARWKARGASSDIQQTKKSIMRDTARECRWEVRVPSSDVSRQQTATVCVQYQSSSAAQGPSREGGNEEKVKQKLQAIQAGNYIYINYRQIIYKLKHNAGRLVHITHDR